MYDTFEEFFDDTDEESVSGQQSSIADLLSDIPNRADFDATLKPTDFRKESSNSENRFFGQIQSLLSQIQSPSNVPYDFTAQAPNSVEGLNALLNYQPSQDANLQENLAIIRRQAQQGYEENILPQLTTQAFNSGAIDNDRYSLVQSNANRELQTNIADNQTKALYGAEQNNRQRISELLNNANSIYTGAANAPLVQASAQDAAANFEVYNLLERLQPLLSAGDKTTQTASSGSKNKVDPLAVLKIFGFG